MTHFRFRYTFSGPAHVQVRVFAAKNQNGPHAKLGELMFGADEFLDFMLRNPRFDFVHEDTPLPDGATADIDDEKPIPF